MQLCVGGEGAGQARGGGGRDNRTTTSRLQAWLADLLWRRWVGVGRGGGRGGEVYVE